MLKRWSILVDRIHTRVLLAIGSRLSTIRWTLFQYVCFHLFLSPTSLGGYGLYGGGGNAMSINYQNLGGVNMMANPQLYSQQMMATGYYIGNIGRILVGLGLRNLGFMCFNQGCKHRNVGVACK